MKSATPVDELKESGVAVATTPSARIYQGSSRHRCSADHPAQAQASERLAIMGEGEGAQASAGGSSPQARAQGGGE